MKFKDEYKKTAEIYTPDEKTIARMKANVMAGLDGKKKSLPLRRFAMIGGSVAACAAITVGAVLISGKSGGVNLSTGSVTQMSESTRFVVTSTAPDFSAFDEAAEENIADNVLPDAFINSTDGIEISVVDEEDDFFEENAFDDSGADNDAFPENAKEQITGSSTNNDIWGDDPVSGEFAPNDAIIIPTDESLSSSEFADEITMAAGEADSEIMVSDGTSHTLQMADDKLSCVFDGKEYNLNSINNYYRSENALYYIDRYFLYDSASGEYIEFCIDNGILLIFTEDGEMETVSEYLSAEE